MGCILACLRSKDDSKKRNKAQLKSSPVPSKTKGPLLSEDQFVSVFISEGSTCEQVADLNFADNRDKGIFDSELKDEVKFLKSCGAILETPAELRKASEKLIAQPLNKDISSSDSSCIPDTLFKKLVWEEQQEDSEFSLNSVAGSKFGKHQSRRHNDGASKTASCVPGTRKFVLDEEQEDSSFEQHSSAGFIFGGHQAQKHNDCPLSSVSQRESAYLESGSESAVLDASPCHDDTKGSVCFGNAKHDPKIESSAESAATLDASPSQNGTQIKVHSLKDVCLESVTHNPGSESGVASRVLDDSPSQDGKFVLDGEQDSSFEQHSSAGFIFGVHQAQKHNDCPLSSASQRESAYLESGSESAVLDASPSHDDTEGSLCFGSAKHDPKIESSAESAATLDASPSQNGTQIKVHSLKDVCLESVTHNPGSESGIASRVLDDSPSQVGKFVLDEEQEDSSFEQHSSAGFIFGVHQAQKHNDCTLSSASQRESAYLESGSESAVLDASPSHDDTKGSVCFGSAQHNPEIESSAESAATLDASPSQNGTQIKVHSLKDVCLESVTHNPGSESGIASRGLDDSPSQVGKFVLDEEQEDSSFEQHSSAGFIFGIHQTQKHNDCTLSSASQRESAYMESGSESAVLDASPSHDDTKGSVCFGSAKHDPKIESSAESAATLDASPSQNGTQIQVHSLKDVCLESVAHNPGSESGIASGVLDDSPSQDGTQIQALGGKNSPYPTPLQLTDEMGTPCTVYPSTRDNLRRKNARVRNQYVYPVLNPAENLAQLKVQQTPVTSSSNNENDKRSSDSNEFDKENYSSAKKLRSLTPLSNSRWKVTSNLENPLVEVLSLSQWLKHPPRDNNKKYACLERTPDAERPIFGVVAMHWNEEDPSKISPKLCGGNGIPNTTTKYKEDQKVSWHATPFEERLDKALSDDKLFPRRKEISRNLIAFNDEGEESNNVILG